jgi:hypothetical protein
MKKLILLIIVFFLCAAPQVSGRLPTHGMSETAETNFVKYVFDAVEDYIKTVDWNENRNYQPEVDKISKILQKYGYTKDQYFVAAQGMRVKIIEDGVLISERLQIVNIKVMLEGNNVIHEQNWKNESATFPELEEEPEKELNACTTLGGPPII